MTKRELLFSVTASDCEWSYTKGSGNGGQKKNKTSSAVHCAHQPSGARGYSEASRSQLDNKKDAFVKMVGTKEFKSWHQQETWKKLGVLDEIERAVKDGLQPANLRMEIKINGKWVEYPLDGPLDIDADNLTVSR